MIKSTARMVLVGGGVAGLMAFTAACSAGLVVDKDDVVKEVTRQYEEQKGFAPDSMSCPEDLKGEVGATLECEMKFEDQVHRVTVKVTSVEGSDVKFNFKVDDKPK